MPDQIITPPTGLLLPPGVQPPQVGPPIPPVDDEGPPLIPAVHVIVHPVSLDEHPDHEPGYRWCVMVGGHPAQDIDFCVNAGHCPDVMTASIIGESHGAAAVRSLRIFGVTATYAFSRLDWDPIPNSADHRELIKLHDDPERREE